ncbi:MAG: phosphoribosylglycinamide formyltransferase [Candidatus Liptonbacteria bacterium]|nr:phosphoribosylglycinamide formyltransferase [Candidatus Liptonbacteria bacterium]
MKIALLISGGGTTAEAIIRATQSGRLTGVEIGCVIASKSEAGGIERSKKAGVPEKDVLVLSPKSFASREEFGEAIIKECRAREVDFVGQYGWLVKTPENVIKAFEGRIVNQHPGPLDPGRLDFGGQGMYGKRVSAARLFFVRAVNRDFWTEATAHRVAAEYDKGAVVGVQRVPILPEDTPEGLQGRVLPAEYEVQIETVASFARRSESPAVNRAVPEGWKAARSTDGVMELVRETSLVWPGEEKILEEAKQKAIELFPHG